MAQEAVSDLPRFYGETTKDGNIVQRPPISIAEEVVASPSQTYQDPHRTLNFPQNGIILSEGPDERTRNRLKAEGAENSCSCQHVGHVPVRRDTYQETRGASFDWYQEARRRASRYDRRRSEGYRGSRRDHERYPDSDLDNEFDDRLRDIPADYRRRDSHRPPLRRPRYESESDPDNERYGGNRKVSRETSSVEVPMRLPWTMWMNSSMKNRKQINLNIISLISHNDHKISLQRLESLSVQPCSYSLPSLVHK